jgi:hypothetical protein
MKKILHNKASTEHRSNKRLSANIKVGFYLWNPLFWKKYYKGNICNISEKGLLISTKTQYFPKDALFEIFIPLNGKKLFIPAKVSNVVWRDLLPDNSCDKIGIEFSNPPEEYVAYVKQLKSVA